MRMALAGHQFPGAFAVPFGTSAAQLLTWGKRILPA
jgi:hypothetical protein